MPGAVLVTVPQQSGLQLCLSKGKVQRASQILISSMKEMDKTNGINQFISPAHTSLATPTTEDRLTP